ncbi:MAG: dimethyl sulfoxide reductase anchor subunit [Gammaproteobacteria bacterium]|nr:dimethyl sulfoxide reductase anchor subunit [Gammaproteobacteria bacterium]MCP5137049.1 dimethyl sulfoxide reductase anchor subunit [Gammaproteobacteria bacterium]
MHPAFSVIFLTTLIGAGQGLFLALFTGQLYALANLLPQQEDRYFYGMGSDLAVLFLGLGLLASFFHLGHPERAWRSAAQWRTSWLSREVIILPAALGLIALYGLIHWMQWTQPFFVIREALPVDASLIVGVLAMLAVFALYIATGMIYACIRFLQEWHSALTVINYALLGIASGFTFAAAFSAWIGNGLVGFYGTWAVILTLAAAVTRSAALIRNRRIKHKSNLQTAIGIRHTHIQQKAQGAMGGSFNTREYMHHQSPDFMHKVLVVFMVLVFTLPILLLAASYWLASPYLPAAAFVVQYLGLLAERWYFFADARHPQNLYYQSVA